MFLPWYPVMSKIVSKKYVNQSFEKGISNDILITC